MVVDARPVANHADENRSMTVCAFMWTYRLRNKRWYREIRLKLWTLHGTALRFLWLGVLKRGNRQGKS